ALRRCRPRSHEEGRRAGAHDDALSAFPVICWRIAAPGHPRSPRPGDCRSGGKPALRLRDPLGGNPSMRELRLNFLVLALAAIVVAPRSGGAADFKTGEMVDKDSASKADGLLPPEILKHYQNGEYMNK